jgi:hypothetical protein
MRLPPTRRPGLVIQALISLVNGGLTLVVLLIAPLGLASVITLTLLITASTFCCGMAGGVLQKWLLGPVPYHGDGSASRLRSRSLLPGTRRLPKR